MNIRLLRNIACLLLTLGSLQAQNAWFVDLNTGICNHELKPTSNENFFESFDNKGFRRQSKSAIQFDFFAGRKWASGWHAGIGFKTLRLETQYRLSTTYEQAIGIQVMTETVNYQNNLKFYQFRVGYDHHFSGGWVVGLRLSAGFDPSPEMFLIETRKEEYALFDQVNIFEEGVNMPEANGLTNFRAIELAVGKDFTYFSLMLYGRITVIKQRQDMRYPLEITEPPFWNRHRPDVNLRYQVNEVGLSVQIPLWFIP